MPPCVMVGPSSITSTRPPGHGRGIVEPHGRGRLDDRGGGIDRAQPFDRDAYVFGRGGVDLVQHQHVGHARDGFAGMVGGDLPRPQRIGECDVQIGPDEREIVVAAVPDDDLGLGLGGAQDRCVVDAGEDQIPDGDMRLVFLPFLDGAGGRVEIGKRCEALHALAQQIAIGHRMAQHRDALAPVAQPAREPARDRRLAAAGAHRRHGDHGREPSVSMVRRGPGSTKSAPAASAREARCITCSCATSL